MISGNPRLLNQLISLNFKCPYQANVMKILDIVSNAIVDIALISVVGFVGLKITGCYYPLINETAMNLKFFGILLCGKNISYFSK